jgi:hypothetical protein
LVAAQFFATVACLVISAALIAISLVIFVLPTVHAVRAWWTVRILYCVALFCVLLTYTFFAFCDSCSSGAGSILNGLNVPILIALIVLAFWIEVPAAGPMMRRAGGGAVPSSTTAASAAPPRMPQAAAHPVKTTRTVEVTPEGYKIVRVIATYADGHQEETETMEEEETDHVVKMAEEEMDVEAAHHHGAGRQRPMQDQTFYTTEQMTTPEGHVKTVATAQHMDGRHEVVETVEEPTLIGMGHGHDNNVVVEIGRTRGESKMHNGGVKVIEEIEYSDGTKEVVESIEEPTMIVEGARRGHRGMDPPE